MRKTLLGCALMGLLAGHAAAGSNLDAGMLAYQQGDYRAARAKLSAAAEQGDPIAQELLGLMYASGPQLYPGIRRDLELARQWFDRAARSGRPVARLMYCALTRPRPAAPRYCMDRITELGKPPAWSR